MRAFLSPLLSLRLEIPLTSCASSLLPAAKKTAQVPAETTFPAGEVVDAVVANPACQHLFDTISREGFPPEEFYPESCCATGMVRETVPRWIRIRYRMNWIRHLPTPRLAAEFTLFTDGSA